MQQVLKDKLEEVREKLKELKGKVTKAHLKKGGLIILGTIILYKLLKRSSSDSEASPKKDRAYYAKLL